MAIVARFGKHFLNTEYFRYAEVTDEGVTLFISVDAKEIYLTGEDATDFIAYFDELNEFRKRGEPHLDKKQIFSMEASEREWKELRETWAKDDAREKAEEASSFGV